MNTPEISYGLFAEAPNLLYNAPSLVKLKKKFPDYVKRAENAQVYARQLARDVIMPKYLEIEKKCGKDPTYVDWELYKELDRQKATISLVPEKMGGKGFSLLDTFVACEELVAADIGLTALFIFNLFWAVCAMVEMRSEHIIRMLQEMAKANEELRPLFFSWALTEPNCGTDNLKKEGLETQKPSLRVKRGEGGYVLNGTKHFITNGSLAHYCLAILPADSEKPFETFSCMFFPTTTSGFSVGRVERKMGHKAKPTAELIFKDVFIPDADVWEMPGRGWRHTKEIMSLTTGFVGMAGLGQARAAFERCVRYTASKKVGNHRLIDENWVQVALGDILQKIMAVRAKCYDFAIGADTLHAPSLFQKPFVKFLLKVTPKWLLMSTFLRKICQNRNISDAVSRYKHRVVPEETVDYFKAQGAALKVAGTELGMEVANKVLNIVGLEGMDHKYGMEKIYRDVKVSQIYEATNQVNSLVLFINDIQEVIDRNENAVK